MRFREETDPLEPDSDKSHGVLSSVLGQCFRNFIYALEWVHRQITSKSLKTLSQGKQLKGLIILNVGKGRFIGNMRADFKHSNI